MFDQAHTCVCPGVLITMDTVFGIKDWKKIDRGRKKLPFSEKRSNRKELNERLNNNRGRDSSLSYKKSYNVKKRLQN